MEAERGVGGPQDISSCIISWGRLGSLVMDAERGVGGLQDHQRDVRLFSLRRESLHSVHTLTNEKAKRHALVCSRTKEPTTTTLFLGWRITWYNL